MAVLSGKAGTLKLANNTVSPISNWKLTITCDNKAYAANDTLGYKVRVAGVRDCSGSFECKVSDSGSCPASVGDQPIAQFHVDGTNNNYYQVPIIIDRIQVEVDINNGQIVAYIIDFSGSGLLVPYGILSVPGEVIQTGP